MEIRTRFAPSPTGYIHIGNLRTALYAYLIAKKNRGTFILRVEDTDQSRYVDGSIEKIIGALKWFRIIPEEGVLLNKKKEIQEKGDKGPYFQSRRLDIYRKYIDKLLNENKAYPCFCTKERLGELRKFQQKNSEPPMYDKKCLNISSEEALSRIKLGENYVIRMNVPRDRIVKFEDQVYGKIEVNSNTIDDQVILKSDGFPTYHLAVVVDDYLMKISHVIRGEDWLPSTPKHVLLYEFFDWKMPIFMHVPNVLNENRKKLSKRQGDVSVDDFRDRGYLPETLVNFLALLGWNPKSEQEYFSLNELIKIFDEKGLHKAGAVFDYKKLDWMNAHYIKEKDPKELLELCRSYFKKYLEESGFNANEEFLGKIVKIEQTRIKKLSDITDNIDFYFKIPNCEKGLLRWKNNSEEETREALKKAYQVLEKIDEDEFDLEMIQKRLLKEAGDKRGDLLWPLRVAVSGKRKSPSPFELAWILGKKESLQRIKEAMDSLC